jgi:hypothetical protein
MFAHITSSKCSLQLDQLIRSLAHPVTRSF